MSKLESAKVDPLSYNILDDVDIKEYWILQDKDYQCILKLGVYERCGYHYMRVYSPLIPLAFIENKSEYKHGEEETYIFISESVLKFKKDFPEIFENLGGFNER